jgi:hypothetical protein
VLGGLADGERHDDCAHARQHEVNSDRDHQRSQEIVGRRAFMSLLIAHASPIGRPRVGASERQLSTVDARDIDQPRLRGADSLLAETRPEILLDQAVQLEAAFGSAFRQGLAGNGRRSGL